ncbi:FCD domain-containing protein [Oceanimonas marisflavi]|uniref:FCD domain-containing protein n=1 Tax=Oceanimonas marisflavi TaxID=2059724 RepID=UPI000D316F63
MFEAKRLYQEIGLKLKQELESGRYRVGDRLPPERDIAEQQGVSRTVVREALIMLELENLVDVRKGSGVYVIRMPDKTAAGNNAPLSAGVLNDVGPFELLQARQLLESDIAAFAATQVTKNDIAQMRQALELERQALESGSNDEGEGDRQFHLLIAQATQNSVLIDLVQQLWLRRQNSPMWQTLHRRISDTGFRRSWLDDHLKILAALQHKNAKAARQAMWQHLEHVKETLLELSDIEDPNFDGYLFNSVPAPVSE